MKKAEEEEDVERIFFCDRKRMHITFNTAIAVSFLYIICKNVTLQYLHNGESE